MCGIAGYIGERYIEDDIAIETEKIMQSRGPDNSGKIRHRFSGKNIILLHSHLSIIGDLNSARQPITSKKQILVYNGEIYNYLELASQYRSLISSQNSDTQVLASLLENLPIEIVLPLLDGMWSFAFFDRIEEKLILTRDSFGEKPLYFMQDGNGIYFGSSPQYIASLRGISNTPNYKQLTNFLLHDFPQYSPNDSSYAKDIVMCKPGTYLSIDRDLKLKEDTFIKRNDLSQYSCSSQEEIISSLYNKLEECVLRRFRGNYPISLFLSGGIDSSAILSIAAKHNKPLTSISIRNNDKRYDESKMIDTLLKRFNCKHEYIDHKEMPGDTFDVMQKISSQYYSPLPSPNYILYNSMCRKAFSSGARIVLTGLGGDELFAGYLAHWRYYFASIKKDSDLFTKECRYFRSKVAPYIRNKRLTEVEIPPPKPNFSSDHENLDSSLFKIYRESYRPVIDSIEDSLLKNKLDYDTFFFTLPPHLLASDMVAMSNSLESRSPLLSNDIYTLVRSIPDKYLMSKGFNKYIFRQMFKDRLPESVCFQSEKKGFNCEFNPVKIPSFRDIYHELQSDSYLKSVINFKILDQKILNNNYSNSFSKFLFRLFSCYAFKSI